MTKKITQCRTNHEDWQKFSGFPKERVLNQARLILKGTDASFWVGEGFARFDPGGTNG